MTKSLGRISFDRVIILDRQSFAASLVWASPAQKPSDFFFFHLGRISIDDVILVDRQSFVASLAWASYLQKPSDFFFCLFSFVNATKFRDSSAFSDCVQTTYAKSCLPCQFYIEQKTLQRYEFSATVLRGTCKAQKGLGTSLAVQCYALRRTCKQRFSL